MQRRLAVLSSGYRDQILLRFSLFDVAAKLGITSLLEYAISNISTSGISLAQFQRDISNGYSSPLLSATSCSDPQVFARLLDLRAIETDGRPHLTEQLDSRIDDSATHKSPVDVEFVIDVSRNTRIGVQLLVLLISERCS